MTDLPSWDKIDAMAESDPLELRDLAWRLRQELAAVCAKAEAVAEEYERVPRPIASGAVASMLREWVGV